MNDPITAGPWERRAIPGHLFELHNTRGEIVLRIRGGMMPTLGDARLLEAAPDLLDLAKYFAYASEGIDTTDIAPDTVVQINVTFQAVLDLASALAKAAGTAVPQ